MRTMDSGPLDGSSIDRRMWRRLLPLGNLVLAMCLIFLGHYQQRTAEDQQRSAEAVRSRTTVAGVGKWTPPPRLFLAPATQVAYAVDFPALIVAFPLTLLSANVVFVDTGFFCGVILTWYFVGLIIDLRGRMPNGNRTALFVLSLVGFVLSLLGVWFGARAVGLHYIIPPLGAVLWSAALGAFSMLVLKKGVNRKASLQTAQDH
jgi:hypothetical protein